VSPDGTRLSAVAAGDWIAKTAPLADNSLVVFDARPLRDGKVPTLLGKVPVDSGPVSLVDTGSRIIVGFITPGAKPVVIDPSKVTSGKGAVLGKVPVSMTATMLSADGRTLFGWGGGLNIVDLERVKLEPVQ
jgi:hypothetical protein